MVNIDYYVSGFSGGGAVTSAFLPETYDFHFSLGICFVGGLIGIYVYTKALSDNKNYSEKDSGELNLSDLSKMNF